MSAVTPKPWTVAPALAEDGTQIGWVLVDAHGRRFAKLLVRWLDPSPEGLARVERIAEQLVEHVNAGGDVWWSMDAVNATKADLAR